jgi:hypothetical protein
LGSLKWIKQSMAPIVLEPVRAWLAAQLSVPGKSSQNNTVDVCPAEVEVNEGYGDTGQLCQSAIAHRVRHAVANELDSQRFRGSVSHDHRRRKAGEDASDLFDEFRNPAIHKVRRTGLTMTLQIFTLFSNANGCN